MHVLVVSEDAKERSRAVSALELHPEISQVTEVTTAAEVRRRVLDDGESFDVLVVDGDLSPRGGFATLYDIRSRAELEGRVASPALVMAGREQDRWLAHWAGANHVLIKPVDPFELPRVVVSLQGAELAPYGDDGAALAQVAAATHDHR